MGFIKAALSAGISSFQDSKFKEAITLPEAVPATALAIKGQLLTKDPDGRSRQSKPKYGPIDRWFCRHRSPRLCCSLWSIMELF